MKYQIVTVGSAWFLDQLKESLRDFKDILFVSEEKCDSAYPYLCLFYGNSNEDSKKNDNFVMTCISKSLILPICHNWDDFKTNFPVEVAKFNGFALTDDELSIQKLANLILRFFGLLVKNRKVFISYRRIDTKDLAEKLFDLLIRNGYTPFLDSYSIGQGVDFQTYLRQELVDSDIIILLDSQNFSGSDYCMEELNLANEAKIPFLDVLIHTTMNPIHVFSQIFDLAKFMEEHPDCCPEIEIFKCMESSIMGAYSFKRKAIEDDFKAYCNVNGLKPLLTEGIFYRDDSSRKCFNLLTYVPHGVDYYELCKQYNQYPQYNEYTKSIIYNGTYCMENVKDKLFWYNESLPIKSLDINQ
jgi:hypothetical protein